MEGTCCARREDPRKVCISAVDGPPRTGDMRTAEDQVPALICLSCSRRAERGVASSQHPVISTYCPKSSGGSLTSSI